MSDEFFGPRTYSQNGDDIVLACIFEQLGIDKPSYLDLGAFHPFRLSNTALFYERGSTGVNVEANPERIKAFHRLRPKDINLNYGVGTAPGFANLCRYGDHGFETFKPEWGLGWRDYRDSLRNGSTNVEVKTVKQILGMACGGAFPDLLSIDIEGMELEVLESIEFDETGRPMVIDVEAHRGDWDGEEIIRLLKCSGFFLMMRCVNNCVFVRDDLKSKVF